MSRIFSGALASVFITLAMLLPAGCTAGAPAESSAIGVNALTSDLAAFSGEILVEGVVQNVEAGSSVIWLIDVTEYESCGLVPCAGAGFLPIELPTTGDPSLSGDLYDGTLPDVEDKVTVAGTVRAQDDGSLYFDAERVERGSTTLIVKR